MVLHPLKDYQPIPTARLDAGLLNLEVIPDVHIFNFYFYEFFHGLCEGFLHFADAYRAGVLVDDVFFNEGFGEEMGFTRAATAMCAFIASGSQKG